MSSNAKTIFSAISGPIESYPKPKERDISSAVSAYAKLFPVWVDEVRILFSKKKSKPQTFFSFHDIYKNWNTVLSDERFRKKWVLWNYIKKMHEIWFRFLIVFLVDQPATEFSDRILPFSSTVGLSIVLKIFRLARLAAKSISNAL